MFLVLRAVAILRTIYIEHAHLVSKPVTTLPLCQIPILCNALEISPAYYIKEESSLMLCFKHRDFYPRISKHVITEVK